MIKDRPNKIPQPKTIARHFAQGRYCDYPADIVLSAVNSHDLDYDPVAIPIKVGFKQLFIADFEAFVYLSRHKTKAQIRAFLADPDGFMAKAGIELPIPFDEYAPKIFAALVEKEMLAALRSPNRQAVCNIVYRNAGHPWCVRHPERYPKWYMKRECFWGLRDIPYSLDDDAMAAYGFTDHMSVNLLHIIDYFSEE